MSKTRPGGPAAAVFTVPIIVLFFLARRTFIQGIATTGVKG